MDAATVLEHIYRPDVDINHVVSANDLRRHMKSERERHRHQHWNTRHASFCEATTTYMLSQLHRERSLSYSTVSMLKELESI